MTVIRNSVLSSAKPSSPQQSRLRMVAPSDSDSVNRVLERAFAPLHKRALGVAVGATVAMVVFAVTVFHIIARPIDIPIDLASQYFYGYDTTWRGAFIGVWWGFVSGFVAGWFLAFLRNFMVATWIFVVRTKASLAQTQDFLDHI
jgi:hypothetical protein